jgi:quercetin 2,3-dioxygenase
MSVLDRRPESSRASDGPPCPDRPTLDLIPAREAEVAGRTVRRALPRRQRRKIGAWCFADHFGPASSGPEAVMAIGPHPHIGMQTVTWLVEGEVLHRDSLGAEQLLRPGQLNLMTSGVGIAHAEETPEEAQAAGTGLHGIQLWVALPDGNRGDPPAFEHHPHLPGVAMDGFWCTVFVGEFGGDRSPATVYSPLVGVEIVADGATGRLTLDPAFEHGLIVVEGEVTIRDTEDAQTVGPGVLAYLGRDRSELQLSTAGPTRALLLGGAPMDEDLLMWWNFVGRDWDEIRQARDDWEARAQDSGRFGTVASPLAPIPAPPLPR